MVEALDASQICCSCEVKVRDIERAAKLSTVVSAAALGLCVGHILARPLRRAARRVRAR